MGFPPNHDERLKYLQPILQITMIQSAALATSRTRYGLREPKTKAATAGKANNQHRDKHVLNLKARKTKSSLASNFKVNDEIKSEIDLGRSSSHPGAHDCLFWLHPLSNQKRV